MASTTRGCFLAGESPVTSIFVTAYRHNLFRLLLYSHCNGMKLKFMLNIISCLFFCEGGSSRVRQGPAGSHEP